MEVLPIFVCVVSLEAAEIGHQLLLTPGAVRLQLELIHSPVTFAVAYAYRSDVAEIAVVTQPLIFHFADDGRPASQLCSRVRCPIFHVVL